MEEIRALLEGFCEACGRFDAEAAARFHRLPLAIATRERGWVCETEAALREEFEQMFDFYRYNGTARLEMADLAILREDTAVALAVLDWRALDGGGGEVARFQMTYAIGRHEGERRITGLVVHNETYPRDRLSAEALAALRSRR